LIGYIHGKALRLRRSAMRRRVHVVVLLCCGGLAPVPFAAGASPTADTSAVISGTGTSYKLIWTAGGNEALRCMGLILLPGEVPTGATGPAGWTIRVLTLPGDAQGRWVVHATKPPPGLAPRASLAIRFTTQASLAPNQPREIRFSSTCVVGSDVVKRSTGPTPPPPPPPPKPCRCVSLNVELGRIREQAAQRVVVDLEWALACTKGKGRCTGQLITELSPASKRADVGLSVIQDGSGRATGGRWLVTCEGRCFLSRGREITDAAFVDLRAPPAAEFGPRGIESVMLEVDRVCTRELTTRRFLVAFNAGGKVSLRRSDLNGNGVADGREKRNR
jgi:hypothetical protein